MDVRTQYETHLRVENSAREPHGERGRVIAFPRKAKAVPMPFVECGSGWYHEAAIEEAKGQHHAA